jgi:hypothetical protein
MQHYQHTQIGWLLLAVVGGPLIFIVVRFGLDGSLPALIVGAVLVLFATLHVTIDESAVKLRFGAGLVRRRIALARIRETQSVRNRWYWGWGIRHFPGGTLYNVSGLSAVELILDDGRRVRIGTDDPERLLAALNAAIGPRAPMSDADRVAMAAHMQRSRQRRVLVGIAVAAGIVLLLYAHLQAPAVALTPSSLAVRSGFYAVDIPLASMTRVSLEPTLPRIALRTNGFAAGGRLRGHFRLADDRRARLFVNTGQPPFVVVETTDDLVIVNVADPAQTRQLYDRLIAARRDAGIVPAR